jgi:hypothetical protein
MGFMEMRWHFTDQEKKITASRATVILTERM